MSRFQIEADSLSTKEVRELAVALHHVGLTAQLQVGVEGPEAWHAKTPMLTAQQFASVAADLARANVILWPHLTVGETRR